MPGTWGWGEAQAPWGVWKCNHPEDAHGSSDAPGPPYKRHRRGRGRARGDGGALGGPEAPCQGRLSALPAFSPPTLMPGLSCRDSRCRGNPAASTWCRRLPEPRLTQIEDPRTHSLRPGRSTKRGVAAGSSSNCVQIGSNRRRLREITPATLPQAHADRAFGNRQKYEPAGNCGGYSANGKEVTRQPSGVSPERGAGKGFSLREVGEAAAVACGVQPRSGDPIPARWPAASPDASDWGCVLTLGCPLVPSTESVQSGRALDPGEEKRGF